MTFRQKVTFGLVLPFLLIRYAVSPAFRRKVNDYNDKVEAAKASVVDYYQTEAENVG